MRCVRPRPFALALGALVLVLAILAWRVLRHTGTGYDVEYHVAWGRDMLHGRVPPFDQQPGPTEHPLLIVVGALADLVPGIGPHPVLHAGAYACLAGLVVIVFLIGTELYSWPAGVLAGVLVAFNAEMASNTALASQDVPAAMLVLLSVLLAIRSPRRAVPPLVVLGLAGLLRPEAWGLAAAFVALHWRGRTSRERLGLVALAAAAPAVWLGADLLVTGRPLYSFTLTKSHAASDQLQTGIGHGARQLIHNLRDDVGGAVLYGGSAAVVAFGALQRWRRIIRPGREVPSVVWIPVGALVLTLSAFVVLGAGALPLYERFVFVPASLLVVFFAGGATLAWRLAPPALVAAAALLGLGGLAGATRHVSREIDETRVALSIYHDHYAALHGLERLAQRPDVRALIRVCGRGVAVTPYGARPYLANALRSRLAFVLTKGPLRPRVALFAPDDQRVQDVMLMFINRPSRPIFPTPPGYRRAATNSSWRVLTRRC
jgi:hypothetical protein